MAEPHDAQTPPEQLGTVDHHLAYLKLGFIAAQYAAVATQAAPVETRLEQGFNIVMTSPVRSTDALTRGRQVAGRTD